MLYSITRPILTKTEALVLIARRSRKRKVNRSRAHQVTRASHPGGAAYLAGQVELNQSYSRVGVQSIVLKDVCNAGLRHKVSDAKLWASTAN